MNILNLAWVLPSIWGGRLAMGAGLGPLSFVSSTGRDLKVSNLLMTDKGCVKTGEPLCGRDC